MEEKYSRLVFVDTFVTFEPSLGLQAQSCPDRCNITAKLQKRTQRFLDRVTVFEDMNLRIQFKLQKFEENATPIEESLC